MSLLIELRASSGGELPEEGEATEARFGVKGASLIRMARMGLSVPEAVLVDRDTCARCFVSAKPGEQAEQAGVGGEIFEALLGEVEAWLDRAQAAVGPWELGIAVRSSPCHTAPGLLPTILSVGQAAPYGEGASRDALDARRVFLESCALSHGIAPSLITRTRAAAYPRSWRSPRELEAGPLLQINRELGALLAEHGWEASSDPKKERRRAIKSVLLRSRLILDEEGSDSCFALVLQRMVHANTDRRSGAGVAYSRHPITGAAGLGGDFLPSCLGVAVVGGRTSPERVLKKNARRGREEQTLEACCPELIAPLREATLALEAALRAPVEIEIGVEEGRLMFLQHRAAALSPAALAKALVAMVGEGGLDIEEALGLVDEATFEALFEPRLPDLEVLAARGAEPLATGLAASQGVATGSVLFDPERVADKVAAGEAVILVRAETRAEDAFGLRAATGILTTAGGLTCHGAVIARALRKPCVVGASSLRIDYEARQVLRGDEVVLDEGERVTIDGGSGQVFAGTIEVVDHPIVPESEQIRAWREGER